jgi:putative protease
MALKKKKKAKKTAKKVTRKKGGKKIKKNKVSLKKKFPVKKTTKTEGNLIGLVTHYFPHVQAAVIKLKGPLSMGETLKIKGHTTDLTQTVTSMQIDRVNISTAKKRDEIGLLVNSRVRQGDKVYKL